MFCKLSTKLCPMVLIGTMFLSSVVSSEEPTWHFGKTFQLHRFPPFHPPSNWDKSCSQYIAASLLESIGVSVNMEMYDAIGREINPKQDGVYYSDLVNYLDKHFRCEPVENASYGTIWRHVNSGYPVIARVEASNSLHTVMIAGYIITPDGFLSHWLVEDNGLVRGILAYQEFEDMWGCPNFKNEGHFCILIHPSEQQESLARLKASDIVANLAAQNTAYLRKASTAIDDSPSLIQNEKSDVIDSDLTAVSQPANEQTNAVASSLMDAVAATANAFKAALQDEDWTSKSSVFDSVWKFVEIEFPNLAWLIPYLLIPVILVIFFYVLRILVLLLSLPLRLVNRER